MESSHNEWLNGDRSHDGALERLTRAIFGNEEASITWDAKTDTVYVTASEEAIREMYGYDRHGETLSLALKQSRSI